MRDAVCELAHAALREARIELGLAKKDDLQKLVLARFEVGEQADFFEGLGWHGMRLVNQDDDLAASSVDLEQSFLQRAQQQVTMPWRQRDPQFLGNGKENLLP